MVIYYNSEMSELTFLKLIDDESWFTNIISRGFLPSRGKSIHIVLARNHLCVFMFH